MKNLGTKKEWAMLTMVFGAGTLFVAVNLLVESQEFEGCPTTVGVVAAVDTQGDGIVTKKRSFSQVRYMDATGTERIAPLNERLQIGRKVQIAYQTDDPAKIRNMDGALTRDQALLMLGISGLVTLLSVAGMLWPANSPMANSRPVTSNTGGRSISGLRGFGLAGVVVAIALGGMAIQKNAYKTVETTTVAEVVRASDVGLNQAGLVAQYKDQNGTVRHTALDASQNHKPGDRISFQYQAESNDTTSKLYTRPWMQVAFLALCGILGLVVLKSGVRNEPRR